MQGIPLLPELKVLFYELLIRYHSHYNNYLEMARCFRSLFEAEGISQDPTKWTPLLRNMCWCIALSPGYSTDQGSSSDRLTLLTSIASEKKLADLPTFKALLTTLLTSEIIPWVAFEKGYAAEVQADSEIFGGVDRDQRLKDLRLRVTEHNVMVVAKYYTRVTVQRLGELLDLPVVEAEKQLSDLVVSKAVSAKVDRPAGVIRFGKKQEPEEVLNAWSNNISRLLHLVDKVGNQISKEQMVKATSSVVAMEA